MSLICWVLKRSSVLPLPVDGAVVLEVPHAAGEEHHRLHRHIRLSRLGRLIGYRGRRLTCRV